MQRLHPRGRRFVRTYGLSNRGVSQTHQVPARVTIPGVDPLALGYDLAHLAPALLSSALISSREQLIATLARGRGRNRREGQYGKCLAKLLLRELLPYFINALLWWLLWPFLLLLTAISAGLGLWCQGYELWGWATVCALMGRAFTTAVTARRRSGRRLGTRVVRG